MESPLHGRPLLTFLILALPVSIFTSHLDSNAQSRVGGIDPKPPALKAVARAGSDVVIHWSGMIRMHHGPVLSVRCSNNARKTELITATVSWGTPNSRHKTPRRLILQNQRRWL